VLAISAPSIDRLLTHAGRARERELAAGRALEPFCKQIPVRAEHWDVSTPGFIEADSAAHCRRKCGGRVLLEPDSDRCVHPVDGNRRVFNRGQYAVAKRIAEVEAALPFAILGFDTDNRSEFLYWQLLNYLTRRRHPVSLTRSRAYRKNDNARVEQKNCTRVRQLVGYARLEHPRAAELLNELYSKEWGWFRNFFCPVIKHLRTEVEGSRKRRITMRPPRPLSDSKPAGSLVKSKSQALENLYRTLDPFALKEAIEPKLRAVLRYQANAVLQSGLRARESGVVYKTGSSGLSASGRALFLRARAAAISPPGVYNKPTRCPFR
jgi:hypothetical protein